jgi:hypothetical protein
MSKLRVDYEEQMKSTGGGGKWVSFKENNVKLQWLMRAVSELQDKMNHNSMTYTERKTECLQLVQTLDWLDDTQTQWRAVVWMKDMWYALLEDYSALTSNLN